MIIKLISKLLVSLLCLGTHAHEMRGARYENYWLSTSAMTEGNPEHVKIIVFTRARRPLASLSNLSYPVLYHV